MSEEWSAAQLAWPVQQFEEDTERTREQLRAQLRAGDMTALWKISGDWNRDWPREEPKPRQTGLDTQPQAPLHRRPKRPTAWRHGREIQRGDWKTQLSVD